MKKKIVIILIAIAIIALIAFLVVRGMTEEGRKYSVEEVKDYNYFVLQENNKYGVIDKSANVIIEPKYENVVIPNPSKAIFVCSTENNQTKIYDENKQEKFTNYEEVTSIRLKNIVTSLPYEKSVLRYKKDGKYGLIDFTGKQITNAIYDELDALETKEGELLVGKDGKYGVINIKGNILIPIQYETVEVDNYYTEDDKYEEEGYIVSIRTDDGYRYGYIDVNGKEILKNEYNDLSRITDIKDDNNIYLIASKNGQYGAYKNDNQIINHEYQSITYNKNNDIFIVEKSKRYGVCKIDGSVIVDVKYTQIDISGKYLYAKDISGKTTVLDTDGKEVKMSENMAKISVDNGKYTIVIESDETKTSYGIQDSNEKELVKPEYSYIEYLFDNYFIASKSHGKVGIIDDKGIEKIELKYSSIQKVKETKLIQAIMSSENTSEIYTPSMEKICNINNAIINQVNGYIKIYNGQDSIYITEGGKKVDNKQVYKDNTLFAIKKDSKWGFENKSGEIKVQCIYDRVTEFNEFGYAGINKDGKWGVIDKEGKVIVEPNYKFEAKTDPDFIGKYYKVSYGFEEAYYTK